MNWAFWKSKHTVQKPKDILDDCSDATLSRAILDKVYPILEPGDKDYLDISYSNNYDVGSWRPRLDKQQQIINELLEWAKTLPGGRIKNQYVRWIRHYQRNIDSAWGELRTHESKNRLGDYNRKNKQLEAEINETIIGIPTPNILTRN